MGEAVKVTVWVTVGVKVFVTVLVAEEVKVTVWVTVGVQVGVVV